MKNRITVMPEKRNMEAATGENLLQVLRAGGFFVDASCGGNGSCGKCKVLVDGEEKLACRTTVDRDMVVALPQEAAHILTHSSTPAAPGDGGLCLAFDIGTTTVAGYLLNAQTGRELACGSQLNPQISYGADVISRIQHALNGRMEELTGAIRNCVAELTNALCEQAGVGPHQIDAVSMVGNPAMQQLFLGISPENLAQIPFAPVLTQAKTVKAADHIPVLENARLLIVPDVSGFVGADTLACVLATGLHEAEELTLLVDIGTNGEMVLGNKHRMAACSTAAGPALEGANIQFGMRGQTGAIDHVRWENGQLRCSVIGGGEAVGICGSGLIDAVAAALDAGLINERGRIQNDDHRISLTDRIYLTQEDIRQVQLAKGAIAAGIELLAAHLGVTLQDIQRVYLAGAFGTFMNPSSACRIGLLPSVLEDKILAVGNAAGGGAKILAGTGRAVDTAQALVGQMKFVELAAAPQFQGSFARNMRFSASESYWCQKALTLGFSKAMPLDVATLQPRQDVRDMCAADRCGAYGNNWTCPPHCGSLADCEKKMRTFSRGILLQTVGKTEKAIDTKAYRRTEAEHLRQFHAFCDQIRKAFPNALCLGSGGCRICEKCAFPEPCRFPEKACSSMEGYGLFVAQVCRDNGCEYHYGEKTVTYTACVLF